MTLGYLWLFMLSTSSAQTELNRRRDVPAVVFQRLDDFYTSQNSWLIAFELDIAPYEYLLRSISAGLSDLKSLIQSMPSDSLRDDLPREVKFSFSLTTQAFLSGLQKEYDLFVDYHSQLIDDIVRIQTLLDVGDRRHTRALLPFLGTILRGLTGVADQKTVNNIRREIARLARAGQHVAHIVEEGITILNRTRIDVENNRITINKLLNITQKLEAREFEVLKAQQFLEVNVMINHRVSSIRFALDDLAVLLTNSKIRLADLFIGHLTPNVIDPIALYGIL